MPLQTASDFVSQLPEVARRPEVLATIVLIVGFVFGLFVGRLNKRLLTALGVPRLVEGTPFERTAQSIGTSTVTIVARLSSWFVYAVTVLAAIHTANLLDTQIFWLQIIGFVPQIFIAVFVLIFGFVAADKAELLVSERLKSVKIPEVSVIPRLVKYSVLYVALLIALGQVGVNTMALIALLAVYAFAIVVFAGLAFKDFLPSVAAGVYLLLNQPFGIGDEVEIGDHRGVVQGMDVLVTRIENDEEEYIIPNHVVLEHGVVRMRD